MRRRLAGLCVALLLAATPSCVLLTDLDGLAGAADALAPPEGDADGGDPDAAASPDAEPVADAEPAPTRERACAKPHTFCADFDISEDPVYGFRDGDGSLSGSIATSATDAWSSPRAFVAKATPLSGSQCASALVSTTIEAAPAIHLSFRLKLDAADFASGGATVAQLNAYSDAEGLKQAMLVLSSAEVNLRVTRFDPSDGQLKIAEDNKAPFAIDGAWHLFEIDVSTQGELPVELKIDGVSRLTNAKFLGSDVVQYHAFFGLTCVLPRTTDWQVRFDDVAIDIR